MVNCDPSSNISAQEQLRLRTGGEWRHLAEARRQADLKVESLETMLQAFPTADASIVVVGSLARREFTAGSDIDWTLVLDGMSQAEHWNVAQAVLQRLNDSGETPPGPEGVFGTLISSHDLIHYIGGQDDTNENMTRRVLLLLESRAIGRPDAYDRVIRNLLQRYVREDDGLWHGSGEDKVPRFLFNDVARYWRTMAVDFAYKQRSRNNKGFALRNIKLRLSRKLLFLAGMVACFECHLGFSSEEREAIYRNENYPAVITKLRDTLQETPLEILAGVLLRYRELDSSSKKLFDAYDEFIAMLGENEVRERLKKLTKDNFRTDPVFNRGQEIGYQFQGAINEIFLNRETELGRLTIKYGVF